MKFNNLDTTIQLVSLFGTRFSALDVPEIVDDFIPKKIGLVNFYQPVRKRTNAVQNETARLVKRV
jgi:hypothetical protein